MKPIHLLMAAALLGVGALAFFLLQSDERGHQFTVMGALPGDWTVQAEAAHERRRTDPRARAEHVSEWKTSMKTLKYHPKHKRRD